MKSDYPIIKINSIEPFQDFFDDGEGNRWNVARLIDDTKDLVPFDCPIAALDIGGKPWDGSNILSLAWHCKKVNDADLTKPIILWCDGGIADGRHRLIKSLMLGKKTIKAVRMTWRPIPDSVDNK